MQKEKLLKKLGKRIKTVRKKKGLSQVELAAIVSKDQQSIQRLEAGKVNPSFFYLCEIAEGLETDIDKLLRNITKA